MTHKIMIISIVLAFFGLTAYSQSDATVQYKDKSYVVSKKELTETIARLLKDKKSIDDDRFLFKERELRRLIIAKQLMQFDMMKLYPMMSGYMGGYQNMAPPAPVTAPANPAPTLAYDPTVNTRLNNIETQLQNITNMLINRSAYPTYNDTMRYKSAPAYAYNDNPRQISDDFYLENDKELSEQMRILREAVNNPKSGDITGKDAALLAMLTTLIAQNKGLKEQIEQIKTGQAAPSVVPVPTPTPVVSNTPMFTGEVKKVFFAHDSDKLDAKSLQTIMAVVQKLKDIPSLQVMVKGFASKVGNSAYNQRLSQRRTDAVKSAIIREGIGPGKVLSYYYGEDLSNTDDAHARRVEILFIDSHIK